MVTEIKFPDSSQERSRGSETGLMSSVQGRYDNALFDGYGDMLSVSDLSEIFHTHVKTIQRYCRDGKLPAVMVGGRWFVPKIRLIDYVIGVSA